jgi:hypothetical protein
MTRIKLVLYDVKQWILSGVNYLLKVTTASRLVLTALLEALIQIFALLSTMGDLARRLWELLKKLWVTLTLRS